MVDVPPIPDPLPMLESGLPLKTRRQSSSQFSVLAGLTSVVLLPIVVVQVAQGDWELLFALTFPAALVLIDRCFDYFTPAEYAILYPDRIEFPGRPGKPTIIAWSDVEAVRWPKSGDPEDNIVISLPANSDWLLGVAPIDLQGLSSADRLTLIRYLRLAAAAVEQEGWPQFCRKRTVPIVETVQRAGVPWAGESPLAARIRWFSKFSEKHPFVGGAVSPLALLPAFMSRTMWWALAAIIGVSGAVNIRLLWGQWLQPFTKIVLGTCILLFLLGLLAPTNGKARKDPTEISSPLVILFFAALLIGFPLFAVAILQGWIWIPRALGPWIGYILFAILLLPVFLQFARTRRREKQQAAALEEDATNRWEIYVETGNLPDATATEGACSDDG